MTLRSSLKRLSNAIISSPVGQVKVARRFVSQDNGGVIGQGPGNRHPLLLPAGKLKRFMAKAVAQTDQLEKLQSFLYGSIIIQPRRKSSEA